MKYLIFISIQISLMMHCYAQQHNVFAESQVLLLHNQLQYYKDIRKKDWNYFSCDEELKEGDKSVLIPMLRKNLLITEDLKTSLEASVDSTLMDEDIEQALKRYQRRHNLLDDGIFGAHTVKAMNIPLDRRRRQIEHAINKWEQFALIKESTYLLINLPDFSLSIIDSGIAIQRMKILIGKRTNPTATFYSELSYLIIHPTWIIPHSIAVNEILPLIQTDKNYVHKNRIEVFTYSKNKKIKLLADTIQWAKMTKDSFPYQLQQAPGPWNALGAIKFMFPNEYNIYIHDTPEKYLFNYNKRTFTHGCIRIENPEDLAAWLLHKSNEEIEELLDDSLDDSFFPLTQTVCTFIDHFTTWVDHEGSLQFREDVYQ